MDNPVRIGAARVVPKELVAGSEPFAQSYIDRIVRNITEQVVDRMICELENGELICSMSDVVRSEAIDLPCYEYRRTIKVQRLVRCKDCIYRWENGGDCVSDPDWFCADGVRKVNAE